MASQEQREFDKYLKFLTFKAAQVVVQSRQGRRLKTKSNAQGNDWFNLAVPDDKQVSSEVKRSLEGRIPQPDQPVCIEIQMETPEGNTLVLEVWSITLDLSKRDISVSVTHLLYPRLSLMLKSLTALSRTTPAYRLSRRQEDELHFTFRVYTGLPDIAGQRKEFKHVKFAETSCPYGTIGLSVYYRPSITLPDRSVEVAVDAPSYMREDSSGSNSLSGRRLHLPFASSLPQTHSSLKPPPMFGTILPHGDILEREDSVDGISTPSEEGGPLSGPEPTSLAMAHEQDGYVMVDLTDIRPAFAGRSTTDELSAFLQQCKEMPALDMFSNENSMNITAAMKLIEERSQEESREHTLSPMTVT